MGKKSKSEQGQEQEIEIRGRIITNKPSNWENIGDDIVSSYASDEDTVDMKILFVKKGKR